MKEKIMFTSYTNDALALHLLYLLRFSIPFSWHALHEHHILDASKYIFFKKIENMTDFYVKYYQVSNSILNFISILLLCLNRKSSFSIRYHLDNGLPLGIAWTVNIPTNLVHLNRALSVIVIGLTVTVHYIHSDC